VLRPLSSPCGIAFGTRVAIAAGTVGVAEDAAVFLAEEFVDLGGFPDVERAFGFVRGIGGGEAVGVFGGEEAAVRVAQVALEVGDGAARDGFKERESA
jgi:hypothetical protein